MRRFSARDIALRAKGGNLLRRPEKGVASAVAPVRRCRLRHRHLDHRHFHNGVWNKRPKRLTEPSNNRENQRGEGSELLFGLMGRGVRPLS